jgi:hypothetical protein
MHTYIYYNIYENISYAYHSTTYHIRRTYLHHRFIGGFHKAFSPEEAPALQWEVRDSPKRRAALVVFSNWDELGENLPSGK